MRFLIISKSKYPIPPEAFPGLVDATLAWLRKYQGKLEQVWGFAGIQAGGGIGKVESLEELDTIMTEFPLGPFGEIEVYPLVDMEGSLQRAKQAAQAMAAGGGG